MSQLYLGLDIGSVSLACVLMDDKRQITHSRYLFHEGRIMPVLQELLSGPEFSNVRQVCYNHNATEFFQAGTELNDQIALMEGANHIYVQKSAGIFVIGGETFGFFHFDDKGKYKKYIFNSACAAGTGSFLDQQATRIGLQDSTELAALAESYTGDPPKIATR